MNITPYVNGTGSFKRPFERYYQDPVYNNADNDDDNIPDNPGEILYYIPTRTGQTENYNLSIGLSATWSRPLDKDYKNNVKMVTSNIALMLRQLQKIRLWEKSFEKLW